uniref:Transmembrane protein C9orf5 n=1 Tax=Haemonchus contortus TaxID=6289 RepID=A0A7I5E8Q2_HAECO|nr:Transmembrane protein [Haemonchus contortus]
MGDESNSLAFVERFTNRDQQTALRFAFFNALLFVLTGICFCCLFALYKMMYMFLSPMLWAVLVGTVLFPFKKNVTTVVQGWLTELQVNNTPLVVGVLAMPICALKSFSEKVYSTATSATGLQIVCAYIALKVLTYERTFAYVIGFLGRLYGYIDGFIVFFSEAWVFPLMTLYFCAYTAWIFVQRPGTVNKKVARVLSLPLWIYVLSAISLYFGVFKAAVFAACSVVLGLLSAGAWAVDEPKSPDEGYAEEVNIETESETAKLIENPRESDTSSVVSLDKALGSDSLILIVAGLCALSWMVRHDSALLFIAIPFFIAAFSKIGSNSGFFSAVGGALNSLWSKVYPPIKKVIDISVAGSLRKFVKVLFTSDQMLASSLHDKMDVLSSVVVMGSLAFFALLTVLFVGFQLHNETVHIIRLSSSIINSRPDWLSAARNFTEDKLEDHDIDIDEYVQQGYEQGRAWLASNVRSLVPQDSVRADMLEKQVMQIVDNLYKMWEERDSAAPTTASPEGEVRDWKAQLMSVTDLRAFKEEITLIVKENLDTLMGVARSIWSVLSVNLTFVLSLMAALAGLLFSFGMDILNTIIEIIVFLTMVYYLLSASRERWLPIQWFSDMAELAAIPDTPSSTAKDGKSPSVMESDVTGAIEQAIFGVFVLSLKMAVFYGLYTYFVHSLFDLNIVFVPCLLAALFAAVPIMPPYIVAIFGFLELWLVRDELSVAIVFAVMSFAPHMYVDAAFYREVKFSHPYVTGLSILGGMYWLGLQGAIIGPIILCSFLVLINVYMQFAKPKGEKMKTG